MTVSPERLVLGGLVQSPDFVRDVVPYVEEEYFQSPADKIVFSAVKKFITEYSIAPKRTSLAHEISESPDISDAYRGDALEIVAEIYDINIPELEHKWLVKQAESFCQNKAVFNAITKAISTAPRRA